MSWFRVDTELSGDTKNVEAMRVESSFDLSSGPSRPHLVRDNDRTVAGQAGSSLPMTNPVNIAAMDAWSATNDVRFVVDPGPRLTAVLPVANFIPSLWYHFLVTSPADHFHTPAVTMPTDLEVAFE